MSLRALKNTLYSLALAGCLSCNQHDTKGIVNNELNKATDTPTITKKTDSIQYSTQSKRLNYDNWDTFWDRFTTATRLRDSVTITELTNFPFFQNSLPTSQTEFLESWISQSFDLRNVDTAVFSSDILLQIQKTDNEELPKFDSVRYTYKNGKDFYFAKVNGYYRLVQIITPG